MAKSINKDEQVFYINYGLEDFLSRLTRGMTLTGRVVEVLGNNRYILRIWGYNLLTESTKKFKRSDEVQFDVRQLKPRLVLDFSRTRNHTGRHYPGNMDFFI
ncbi:MAG: hypothetical protein J7L22_03290 [Candidatus Marinimicrobia bacterium]|nr:hypothetical protein [Candidatus Neomarinimicrobiota bacterium]RKY62158.1 MAG: hypothetical protein DRP96_01080 [Candidatus Neomarinimicrobiota bacterium]